MLKTIEKVLLLQDLEILHHASTEHIANLAESCQEVLLEPNQSVFEEDSPQDYLFFLVRGRVELSRNGGSSQILERVALNPWSFFSQQAEDLTAKTLEECLVLLTPREELEDLLTDAPQLCFAILQHLASLGAQPSRSNGDG